MQILIEIQVDDFKNALSILRKEIEKPIRILDNVAETLMNRNKRRHEQEKDPEEKPWKPLAPLTLKRKKSKKILHDTGDMMRTLGYRIDGDVLKIGFSSRLAKYHHFGTKPYTIRPVKAKALLFADIYTKRVNHPGLPARPLLGMPETDREAIRKTVQEHLETLLRRKK